ncbi:hypothetical protein JTB14_026071 [Gonioctena quinquepunctata]|nr:hypothetical protein JTB14_026071 [Gonioctena quinquepunctata]
MDNGDPRALHTGVEAGIKEEDFIQMLVTENDDMFGPDLELAKHSRRIFSRAIATAESLVAASFTWGDYGNSDIPATTDVRGRPLKPWHVYEIPSARRLSS